MSRLQELINEYCPDGVEYKPLSDLASYAKERIDCEQVNTDNYVGVENLLQNKQGKTAATSVPVSGSVIEFKKGDILIGNIRPYLRKIWLANIDGGTNGDVLTVRIEATEQVLPEYLYFVLSSEKFFNYDIQNSKGAKMPRGNKKAVMEYLIPVPPLPVQQEIVRILDSFSSLEQELEQELEQRKKQYIFYRGQLLSFGNNVPRVRLGDAISVHRGVRVVRKQLSDTGYSVYQNSLTSMGGYDKYNCEGDMPFVICAGAAGEVGYSYEPFWAADDCTYFTCPETISYRFLYHFLMTKQDYLLSMVRKASIPRLSKEVISNLMMPVPDISVQQDITLKLDAFDQYCTDLTSGLPAEIALRKKQYEYYRDKLLSFSRKA